MTIWCRSRWRLAVAAALVIAAVAATAALGHNSQDSVVPYPVGVQTLYGLRPTAVGLPDVGESGTVGVDVLATSLRAYHDSGRTTTTWRRSTALRSATLTSAWRPHACVGGCARCHTSVCPTFEGTARSTGVSVCVALLRRRWPASPRSCLTSTIRRFPTTRTCRQPGSTPRRLRCLRSPVMGPRSSPRSAFTATLSRAAWRSSSSPGGHRRSTQLRSLGCVVSAITRAGTASTRNRRASAQSRLEVLHPCAMIEKHGYDIVANVGDQQSDLDGGHADGDFKLPDPFYFISD